MACPTPKDKHEVRQFVGMCSFYRHFIEDFSTAAAPLTDVMGSKSDWRWGPEQDGALKTLKERLVADPVLRLPDFTRPFMIHSDASNVGVGGTLSQKAMTVRTT